jgi:uncharacterized lipoprotein YddW (UPF0748 family)
VRAVWLTTAGGLDWPSSTDPREQQESLRAIVRSLQAANVNTIFFQVRARGDAYYASALEPRAQNLTGTLGMDPGWDPLAFILREAREAGMEVHGWFNVFKINSGRPPQRSSPLHPELAFPSWCARVEGETWLDPGYPGVRAYVLRVAMDLVRRYDLDGLHLDFVRYPGRSFPDDEAFARFGGKRSRDEWRKANIDRLVSELYDSVKAARPRLKFGAAPFGLHEDDPESRSDGAPKTVYQDAKEWLRRGTMDYVVPQVYWDTGASRGDPDFASVMRGWTAVGAGRHVYAGIAAYKPDVSRQLARQIDIARQAGAQGASFFRYAHIAPPVSFEGRYSTPALVPPMPWKDGLPPQPPWDLTAVETPEGLVRLTWNLPRPAADGEAARRFALYRTPGTEANTADPRNLLAVIPGNRESYTDTLPVTGPSAYTVTSLDRLWNESQPVATARIAPARIAAFGDRSWTEPSLAVNTDEETPLVGYRVGHAGPVTLEIARAGASERLAEGTQEEGMYVIGLDPERFQPGTYTVTLSAQGKIIVRPLTIR